MPNLTKEIIAKIIHTLPDPTVQGVIYVEPSKCDKHPLPEQIEFTKIVNGELHHWNRVHGWYKSGMSLDQTSGLTGRHHYLTLGELMYLYQLGFPETQQSYLQRELKVAQEQHWQKDTLAQNLQKENELLHAEIWRLKFQNEAGEKQLNYKARDMRGGWNAFTYKPKFNPKAGWWECDSREDKVYYLHGAEWCDEEVAANSLEPMQKFEVTICPKV